MKVQKKIKVIAIFDIGKTNKKFFLFDKNYQEVFKEYTQIDEIEDEDGFKTEDLASLQLWIKTLFDKVLQSEKYLIKAINFSTYGASLVHLDKEGKVLLPLFNYLKPMPKAIQSEFNQAYGDICAATGAPASGLLNSGMQLYWLKKTQPDVFKKIKYSMHFPQYVSYLFTGIPLSEYTSLGCHTALWDFDKGDYHSWVYSEKIHEILPPIVSTRTSINMTYKKHKIKIGVGVHDSSAALLPYLFNDDTPFLLVSTGTWSISLNPFNKAKLSKNDIQNDCLNYMKIDGGRVKATRFFMGNEYKMQVKKISKYYNKEYGYHRTVRFDPKLYLKLNKNPEIKFNFESIRIRKNRIAKTDFSQFASFEEAFHQLMIELMQVQKLTIERAIGNTEVSTIYIDGGFTENDIFIKLIRHHFANYTIKTTKSPLGSALGAAMLITKEQLNKNFLKENYKMKELSPLGLIQ